MAESKSTKTEKPQSIAGGITQAQLEGWEKKYKAYGGVTIIEVEEGDGVRTAYFKPLESTADKLRQNYSILFKKIQSQDIIGAGEFLRKTLWLGGDEDVKTNAKLAIAVETQLIGTLDLPEARVVKK